MDVKTSPVTHTDAEWRKILTPEQFHIMREHGTERPGSCALNYEKRSGTFSCAGCGQKLFASKKNGPQVNAATLDFWNLLQNEGAEIVLGGNSHFYERLAPRLPSGTLNANGIRQFVVGTGGKSHGGLADLHQPVARRGATCQQLVEQ